MLKRLTRGVVHAMATTFFTLLEVLGWPRVRRGGRAAEGEEAPR